MTGHTPPMGWNSWNTFGVNINEQIVKEVADAVIAQVSQTQVINTL